MDGWGYVLRMYGNYVALCSLLFFEGWKDGWILCMEERMDVYTPFVYYLNMVE